MKDTRSLNKMMKYITLLIIFISISFSAKSQIIFSEPFDEANGAIAGTDNTGGIGWAVTCPGCTGTWDVDNNEWVINNTDALAYWETTAPIDISSCSFFEITVVIEADGDFEDCGDGCNASDWIAMETNIDLGGWNAPANAYACNNGCPDADVIFSTATETGETITYTTGCIAAGNNLQLRIYGQNWAGSEYWRIDDIQVSCSTGPSVNAGLDQIVCEGTDVTLTATNPDVAMITWDNGVNDGVSFTPPLGTTTYTTTATLGACSSTDDVNVTVNATPTAAVNPAGPFAPTSGPQTITASPAGGTWSADCGACINASSGVFDPAVAGLGTWSICYTAGTAPCDDQDCINIVVTSSSCLLSGIPSGNDPTCFGFNDGSATISVSNGTGNLTFEITNSVGTVVNIGNSNTANNLSEGWYYFNVTDEFPCTYIDSVELVSPGQLMIDLVVTDPLCYGVPSGLAVADTVYNYEGSYNQISYFWSPQTGGVNGLGEDTLFNAGEGQYSLLINDENGCDETFDFVVTYPDSLYLQEFGIESAFCRLYGYQSGSGVVFAAATGGVPDYDYIWTNLGTGQTSTNTTWGGRNPGDFQIQVTDNNGCVLTDIITLDSLNPIANFDLTSPQFLTSGVCEGTADVEVHIENTSENFSNPFNPNADTTFFWNFNHDLANPGLGWQLSQSLFDVYDTTYTAEGVYPICLVALNKNGCSDTLCKPITVFDPLNFTAPNFFTPNGDGANDEFTFFYLAQAVIEFNCVIVNRWGVVVGELAAITDGWDGTNKGGNDCPAGVYFYTYSGQAQNGDTFEGQGNVHLIEK